VKDETVPHESFGVALAGGGPLGAIYELGALIALDETLKGFDVTDAGTYVGVSSGAFIAAGLANDMSPRAMHGMFIEDETGEGLLNAKLLMQPAAEEYAKRILALAPVLCSAAMDYLAAPCAQSFGESFQRLGPALPTGIFDNIGVARALQKLFSAPGRTDDFRRLQRKLFVVATDLDSGNKAPFGAPGWDDVPISRAIQASAALPGLFPPVLIRKRWYVDGVLNRTLHASLALQAGAKLLLCVNTLVPFDADLAARHGDKRRPPIVNGGLPLVLAQTFRAIVHSRMEVGMSRYRREYPDADVVLFEPERGDPEMFFANVFSYADRRRLCEHAYQRTRAALRRRYAELQPIFDRHGVTIDRSALDDDSRTLLRADASKTGRRFALTEAMSSLDEALDRLSAALKRQRAA